MKQRKEYAAQEEARLLLRRSTSALDPCAGRPHNDALPSRTAGAQNAVASAGDAGSIPSVGEVVMLSLTCLHWSCTAALA